MFDTLDPMQLPIKDSIETNVNFLRPIKIIISNPCVYVPGKQESD